MTWILTHEFSVCCCARTVILTLSHEETSWLAGFSANVAPRPITFLASCVTPPFPFPFHLSQAHFKNLVFTAQVVSFFWKSAVMPQCFMVLLAIRTFPILLVVVSGGGGALKEETHSQTEGRNWILMPIFRIDGCRIIIR